tara:strand:+ start:132 stop:554 length:423 start_codon:yes stop_codon:yes gene_type:complete
MKMTDIHEAIGDDLGLSNHGMELDDPDKDMKKGFKKEPISGQLMKVLDSRSNPKPITFITTDDGRQHKIGPNMASALLALLRGQIGDMKPQARERLTDKLQTSQGLEMAMSAKTGKELVNIASDLIGMADTDRSREKSIY